jgi:hypothetical protein
MEAETILTTNESEESESYSMQMHDAMAPIVKKYLLDYFGEQMYNLEPAAYLGIDKIIKEGFSLAKGIVKYFHRHRTINDDDLRKEALNKFDRKDAKFSWQRIPQWYDEEYENDDDERFWEDIPESELNEEQKKAKALDENTDEVIRFHAGCSSFMKQGCELLIPAMQKYMEETVSFDLSILSPEGYEHVQGDLDGLADYLFNNLYLICKEGA